MSKPTVNGRCAVTKRARQGMPLNPYCDVCWQDDARTQSCPLLPGSKRKPTKRTKG